MSEWEERTRWGDGGNHLRPKTPHELERRPLDRLLMNEERRQTLEDALVEVDSLATLLQVFERNRAA